METHNSPLQEVNTTTIACITACADVQPKEETPSMEHKSSPIALLPVS